MRNQIVVLAAGKGTRMGNIPLPKVLVMLKNKPLILYLLDEIEKINQLAKPVVVVGYKYKQVMDVLGEDYIYAIQIPQLGTANALKTAKNKIKGENILVLYGDMPFIKAESLKRLIKMHHQNSDKFSMLTSVAPNFENEFKSLEHYGRIIRDAQGRIIQVKEYKDADLKENQSKEINPGIYMFNTEWLWENINQIRNNNAQQEYYLTDLIGIAAKQGVAINHMLIDPKEVIGINNPKDLEIAEEILGNKCDE